MATRARSQRPELGGPQEGVPSPFQATCEGFGGYFTRGVQAPVRAKWVPWGPGASIPQVGLPAVAKPFVVALKHAGDGVGGSAGIEDGAKPVASGGAEGGAGTVTGGIAGAGA